MLNVDRRIIDAVQSSDGQIGRAVGTSLRALRKAMGLTQRDLAKRLGVNQAAVSKIESRGDVHISSLQRYVEALGAQLRILAAFPAENTDVLGAVALVDSADAQLLLPLFSEAKPATEPHPPVILSVHPEYSEKILRGEKTIELRRRFPSAFVGGSRAFIYSTSPARALVGVTSVNAVSRLPVDQIWARFSAGACISRCAFDSYFSGLNEGYALHLGTPRRLERAIPLTELRERFDFSPPQSFSYLRDSMRRAIEDDPSSVPS